MKRKKINIYIDELINKNLIKLYLEMLDDIKLNPEEEQFLKTTEEQRYDNLKRAFKKTQLLKECMDNPQKAQNFHQFFLYFLEWYDTSLEEMSRILKIKSKELMFFYNVKNKVTDFPVDDLTKLIKFLKINLNDTIELLRNSYTLSQMKPDYGAALSRYHSSESTDKGTSMKKALNELLLKSKQADNIQSKEFELYIDDFKRKFHE